MKETNQSIQQTEIQDGGAPTMVPRHIAVIPDGNRRWAQKRGLPTVAGHKEGVENFRRLLAACADRGIRYVSFYAFSTENWKRSEQEVQGLMRLMLQYLRNFDKVMGKHKNKVRFLIAGERSQLSKELQEGIEIMERETANNTDLTAVICINYGGRDEIVHGVRKLASQVAEGTLKPEDITEAHVGASLYTDLPDPDLLIRTSGEERISNFMLWQLAYAEFYFTPALWPDFSEEELDQAIDTYNKRQRRFGN